MKSFKYENLLERFQHGSLELKRLCWEYIRVLAQIGHSEPHSKSDWFDSVILFSLTVEEYLGFQGIISTVFQANCGRNDKRQIKNF